MPGVEEISPQTYRAEAGRPGAVLLDRCHRLDLGLSWECRGASGLQPPKYKETGQGRRRATGQGSRAIHAAVRSVGGRRLEDATESYGVASGLCRRGRLPKPAAAPKSGYVR